MKKFLALAATAAVALTMSSSAMAATADGTLGATSTGTVDVTLTIDEQFQISNITGSTDFQFGTYSGTGDLTANRDLCVYHNGDGSYGITIDDDTATAGFNVENGGGDAITMAVNWNDVTGTAGSVAATESTEIVSTGANTTIADCSAGGNSANLEVTLLEADLQAANAGSYAAELSLVVDPD